MLQARLLQSFRAGNRRGLRGALADARLVAQPWDFAIADVVAEVELLHGAEDPVVPPAHAHWYAAHLPSARLHMLPGELHLSMCFLSAARIQEAVRELRSGRPTGTAGCRGVRGPLSIRANHGPARLRDWRATGRAQGPAMRTPILFAISWLLAGHPAAAEPAPVLVELFTSQGCSSCPPADRLLGELAQRADVAALAFHVTYWDRLGWPDSFGQPAWTDRQRAYAASLGTSGIYTPQMVVAGRLDVVGSDRSRVLAAIELARERAPAALITFTDGRAHLAALTLAQPARLLLAVFAAQAEVAIGRGENSGRLLAYHLSSAA